ncbi:MAG TPA: PilZ domain-containing protein, partial [Vicinamibacterales bacterium]|nr:PilZ domain-containing protein [Vicinamibacterales bacterium]
MTVTQPCTVIIGAADLLPGLKERSGANGEVLTFSDSEALRALEAITQRKPYLVALEKLFAASPRGAALINRIKADPTQAAAEIRVLAHDSDFVRVLQKGAGPPPPAAAPAAVPFIAPAAPASSIPAAAPVQTAAPAATIAPPAPATAAAPAKALLDQTGTRRAPRYKIAAKVDILLDGNASVLVDLSTVGAQVVSPGALKPGQRVRIGLSDDKANLRFNGSVAWASFEIPPGSGPRYRAGIEFSGVDAAGVDAF